MPALLSRPAQLSLPARLIRHARQFRAETGANPDAGVTLMEMLVAMALSTILGAMTVMLFVNINSSSASTTDRVISTASARNALQAWSAYLHVADGTTAGTRTNLFEWLTAKDVLFYADLANRPTVNPTGPNSVATTNPPTMMWLRLDSAGQLVEEQFPSTAAQGAAATVCRILASGVSPGAAGVFTASDANSADMTGQDLGTAPTASAGCQPLPVTVPSQSNHPDPIAQANLQNVRSVQLDVIVRDTLGQHPIEFTSQVVLPTLGGSS